MFKTLTFALVLSALALMGGCSSSDAGCGCGKGPGGSCCGRSTGPDGATPPQAPQPTSFAQPTAPAAGVAGDCCSSATASS